MDRDGVIKHLRGLIISSKFPVNLKQLDRDYLTVIGERIPYQKFGHKSLEEFLKSAPTLRVSKTSNGESVVEAKVLAESAHIVEMVKKQKPPKKVKRDRLYKTYPRTNGTSRSSAKNKAASSSSAAAATHKQYEVYKKPTVASKIVVPEHSSIPNYKHLPPRFQKQHSQSSRLQIKPVAVENEDVFTKDSTALISNTLQEIKSNSLNDTDSSPGSSRRKMITKKMSEINLDRDSGNSSPVNDISVPLLHSILPVRVPDFVPTNDPKVDLKNFVEFHKLGDINVSTKLVNNKRLKLYMCKINIGEHNFTSYPEEFNNPYAAELYCYKQALEELTSKYGKSKKTLFLANDSDILKRIPDMLKKHDGVLWESQLKMDYAQKFNEELPEDWLKIVDRSPFILVQKAVNNYTLKYCKPEEVFQKSIVSKNSMAITDDVSIPVNTLHFDDNNRTFAEITSIHSANEIWCRQIGTEETENYSTNILKMQEYYAGNEENLHVINVNQNSYYVAKIMDNFYRIRALEVTETNVKCFYVDFGEESVVPKDQVFQLKREFGFCAAQAFVCRLAGLEDLNELSKGSQILKDFLYKQVELELAEESIELENEIMPVYMYDCESGSCINTEVIFSIDRIAGTPNIADNITEVNVSHIAKNGDVYVQVQGHGLERFKQLLADLELQVVSDPPTHTVEALTKASSEGKLYLGKYNLDGHWYRVKIIDWSPGEELAQIYYVDFGNSEVVKVKECILYPLEKLDEIINEYPHQAVKTRLLLDSMPKDFESVAKKAIPMYEAIILKVIRYTKDEHKIPLVELFNRSAKSGLFCINKSITMANQIAQVGESSKGNRKAHLSAERSKNFPSGGHLECPPLPELKKYFEIHVPFAVNPYNFFVQPLDSKPQLEKMMKLLQERYKDVAYSPLTLDQIHPGNIYASKFSDGRWYRTAVIKVIHDGSISVFYCDYGYYDNLTLQQLIPLDVEFLELPYQALKAKLSDIKPKDTNWTVEHCDKFKRMVEGKDLYSLVEKIEKDQLYDSDIVLELVLIDTSADDDVYFDQYLIDEGIAVRA